jgi:hypothetical protein
MDEFFNRVWQDLVGRITGPMSFRFILQPLMGTIFAIRDGMADARTGRPPYLHSLFFDPEGRRDRILDGWRSVSRIFFLGLAMDIIYQILVLHTFYIGELLLVALVLAIIPYVLLRGPVRRIFSRTLTQRGSYGRR